VRALEAVDLFLPATERARQCLLVEGAQPDRIVVAPPGVAIDRFARALAPGGRHLIVSPGRLVWEKGHYDVLRALALLPAGAHALLVGAGPEHEPLLRYAADLGLGARVAIRSVPYEEMPNVFASASAVVLGSLPIPMWEEQFGMVLAEAMAAGVPILASTSGAIPEVLAGSGAALFAPGDWIELARLLASWPLAGAPGARVAYPPELVRRYSLEAAAERLDAAYRRVLESD
jgi:glycosyltransferase involved in cell wall biosynthesis